MFARRIMTTTPVVALLSMVALAAAAQPQIGALVTENNAQAELREPRWLPWLGCWELTADAVDRRMVEDTGRRIVCVAPRLDGLGVNLTTHLDGEVIGENTVVADGAERPLPETDCSGSQTASWSSDGRRIHSTVDAVCASGAGRSLVGASLLSQDNRWIEIQAVSIGDGDHREIVVRQYERIGEAETRELGFTPLEGAIAVRAAEARAGAAAPLDLEDVLEAGEIFPVEIVEALILESGSVFPLDSSALIRLADSGIDERVIDLMVAVSFPDEFVVDGGYGSGGGGGGGYYGYTGFGYYPGFYSGSCWGNYYSPFWGPYGPGCSYGWPYYGYGHYPGYGGGGYVIRIPPTGSLYGGRVVNKNGYATVTPRPEPLPSDEGIGGAIRRAFRRDDAGGTQRANGTASSRSNGSSSRSGGSVSRSGFTRSGSSGGGSSGSSGSKPKAKAKAKPKGGAGG